MEEFIRKMQTEVLDCEQKLTPETSLKGLEEWDSFSVVAFIAMASSDYGVRVEKQDALNAETIADLYKVITK